MAGFATGLVAVTSFGVLTKLVPTRVAFVTALAEAALNGAQAFGPFLGGLLYDASGYRSEIVPYPLISQVNESTSSVIKNLT